MRRVALSTTASAALLLASGVATRAEAPADVLFGKSCAPYGGNFYGWLEDAFKLLDREGDGSLNKSELGPWPIKWLDESGDGKVIRGEMTMASAMNLFKALDLDGDGELSASEVPQSLIDAIESHDGFAENNDGKADAVEFATFHAAQAKAKGKPMSGAEIIILLVAAGVGVVAVVLLVQSWRSTASASKDSSQDFLGIDEFTLTYPPEVAEFQELRDAGEADETTLKRALFKRAIATVPMRMYVQAEERNQQTLFQKSMISAGSWANFQGCIEEVKVEMEVIKEEADALQEGWSESIIQESHWLFNHIQEEKKAMEVARENAQRMQEAQAKARADAAAAVESASAAAEREVAERAKAIKELEREAEREAAKKSLTQRKPTKK